MLNTQYPHSVLPGSSRTKERICSSPNWLARLRASSQKVFPLGADINLGYGLFAPKPQPLDESVLCVTGIKVAVCTVAQCDATFRPLHKTTNLDETGIAVDEKNSIVWNAGTDDERREASRFTKNKAPGANSGPTRQGMNRRCFA
jgi:hypothetical protein